MKMYYAVIGTQIASRHRGGKGYARRGDAQARFKVYTRDPDTGRYGRRFPDEINGKLYEVVTDFDNMTSTVRELHPYTGEPL